MSSVAEPFLGSVVTLVVTLTGFWYKRRLDLQRIRVEKDAAKLQHELELERVRTDAKTELGRVREVDGARTAQEGWADLFAAERQRQAEERKQWDNERRRMLDEFAIAREGFEERLQMVEADVVQLRGQVASREEDIEAAYVEIRDRDQTIRSMNEQHGQELRRAGSHIHHLRQVRTVLEAELRANQLPVPPLPDEPNDGPDLAPERRTPTVTAVLTAVDPKEPST